MLCSTTDNLTEKKYMVDGLLSILIPTDERIRVWIKKNLTC